MKTSKRKLLIKIIDSHLFAPTASFIISSFMLFLIFSFIENIQENQFEKNQQAQNQAIQKPIDIEVSYDDFFNFNFKEEEFKIKSGDTILKILYKLDAQELQVRQIISALKKVYDPRDIKVGQKINLQYRQNDNLIDMQQLVIPLQNNEGLVIVDKENDNFKAKKINKELEKFIVKYAGKIENGLFLDGVRIGAPGNIMMNMINLYSFDVDFQRDIRKGDEFEILFESYYSKGGRRIKNGEIIYASLILQKRAINIFNFKGDYYDKKGNSTRKSLLKTPINGARISSGFGYRRHPVLGYNKLHKGVDFAARTGTPILAAGNGTIDYRGWRGGYGKYIRIRHNNEYSTAYAHMSRFNKRFKKGSRVKQGEVIGYVGTTGRSTGPHLHYEILYKGKQINPKKVKSTPGKKLKGSKLTQFKKVRDNINNELAITPNLNKILR